MDPRSYAAADKTRDGTFVHIRSIRPDDGGLLSESFTQLSTETIRERWRGLKTGLTAGEIVERFNISGPSISHHLDLLKQANLVIAEKDGQFINYSLNTTVVDEILKWFMQFKSKKK